MRVAVTDYDGTLYQNGEVGKESLRAIHHWRKKGNVFGIATGRDLSMLTGELLRWNIPYDFAICDNGAIIYDHALNVLASTSIADDVAKRVMQHAAGMASLHYLLSSHGSVALFQRGGDSWYTKMGLPYVEIGFDQAMAATDLQQISFAYGGREECALWVERLNADFCDCLGVHMNISSVDLTAPGIDKATGISEVLKVRGWSEDGLLVIGDADNDAPMLQRFMGFSVPHASEAARRASRAAYATVGEMLEDLW